MNLRASRLVHKKMITTVLMAPINLFYDVTPIGLVLNRFSTDLDVLDNQIPLSFWWVFSQIYGAMSVLLVIGYANWYILISLPFIFALSIWLFFISVSAYRECSRVVRVCDSPIINLVSETSSGCSTIRAFGNKEQFIYKNYELVDKRLLAVEIKIGSWCWFGLRMSCVSIFLMVSATSICIVFRKTEDRVLLAMVLSYIL